MRLYDRRCGVPALQGQAQGHHGPGAAAGTRLRSSTLGEGFDPGKIRDVIAGKRPLPKLYAPAPAAPRRVDLIVDIQEWLRSGTGALSVELVREKELIHGNLQQGDKLVKNIEAWFLAPVLHIHDGARGCDPQAGPGIPASSLFPLACA